MKPILYVDIEGPIITPGGHDNHRLGGGISDYAKTFLHWATDKFDVRWLTCRSPRDAFHVADVLKLRGDAIPFTSFDVLKTDAIDPRSNFYWLDSVLIPSEVDWVARHGHHDRVITVNPLHGVQPEHREKLERALTNR